MSTYDILGPDGLAVKKVLSGNAVAGVDIVPATEVADSAGNIIDPASKQDVGQIVSKLPSTPALTADVAAVKSSIDGLKAVAATDAKLDSIVAKLPSAPALSTDVSTMSAALSGKLDSVKAAIQAQIALASTVWTDTAGNYYLLTQRLNEGTGVITPVVYDPVSGAVISATPAGFKPWGGSAGGSGGSSVDRDPILKIYRATANGTGYTQGQYLGSVTILDETSGVSVVTGGWVNLDTHVLLSAAPTAGTYIPEDQAVPDLVAQAMTATATSQSVQADFQAKLLAQTGLMTETTAATADEGAFSVRALLMRALKSLTSLIGGTRVFAPIPGATVAALATATATVTPIKLPTQAAGTVDSYRVRLRANAAGPVHWVLSADNTKKPTAPTAYAADGTGGAPGDKAIDPGGVEIIRLTDAQQAALAGAGLYLAVLAPTSDANTVLSITPGLGGN